jgi:cytochrome c oxidase subunit 4
MSASDTHAASAHPGPSLPLLAGVLIMLLLLTWVTVAATWFQLGALNLWLALAIATLKGTLVALYFMHLRYEKPFNAVILVAALAFVLLFVGITLQDTLQYQPNIQALRDADPNQYAPELYNQAAP